MQTEDNMQWLEISVNTKPEKIDLLCAKLEALGVEGLIIEDEAEYRDFLKNNRQYWDYIDEELDEAIKGVCRVKFYLEDSPEGEEQLEEIKAALSEYEVTSSAVCDEDWENNWKQYYKPLPVGKRLLIVPEWEEVPQCEGRAVLKLDPGLIFGTGTHPTTQMCLSAIDDMELAGKKVLDLGCGSGILAIAALVLGAESAFGCDIDPKAPGVVMDNAHLNGIGEAELEVLAGDILSDTNLKNKVQAEKYDIVFANIVADVIIALVANVKFKLNEGGVFICSGIIEGRQDEVKESIKNAGFIIDEEYEKDEWHCFKCRMN